MATSLSRPRTPAQIEAARRNGARSRGPVTPEGKARASMNALRHGLTATTHLILEGEDAAEFDALHEALRAEHAPATPTATHLVHRLAVAMWKRARIDRLEQKLVAWAPRPRYITPDGIESGDPEAHLDLRRYNALRAHQAQLAREITQALRELRELRAAAVEIAENEPEVEAEAASAVAENEPERSLNRHQRRLARLRRKGEGSFKVSPAGRSQIDYLLCGEPTTAEP